MTRSFSFSKSFDELTDIRRFLVCMLGKLAWLLNAVPYLAQLTEANFIPALLVRTFVMPAP
jgi:hypothetical protein